MNIFRREQKRISQRLVHEQRICRFTQGNINNFVRNCQDSLRQYQESFLSLVKFAYL